MNYKTEVYSEEALKKHIKLCSHMYSRKSDPYEGFKNYEQLEQFTISKLKNSEKNSHFKSICFATP